jgi:argininosuccinate lyase
MSNNSIWPGHGAEAVKKDTFFDHVNDIDINHDIYLYDNEIFNLLALHVCIYKEKLLTPSLSKKIIKILLKLKSKNDFKLLGIEDVHSLVQSLVNKIDNEAGNNLRIFLSRNDQSQTNMRMFIRDNLLIISSTLMSLSESLGKININIPMPGFTHYRQAMPLMIATYFSSWAEAIMDNVAKILNVVESLDISPLGSGAGYGSYLPINYNECSKYLGFKQFSENPLYISNKRGYDEYITIESLTSIYITISRLAMDLISLSDDKYGIVKLPSAFVSGSSLMPNKKNPDFLELMQGYAAKSVGALNLSLSILLNKTSGYHRDFQICKQEVMDLILDSKQVFTSLLSFFEAIKIDENRAKESINNSSYATLRALELFKMGSPWFESYKKSGSEIVSGIKFKDYKIKIMKNNLTLKKKSLIRAITQKTKKIEDSKNRLINEALKIVE